MSERFITVTVCDFEYEVADGELPNVLCMVAHVLDANLQHVGTIRMWRGEFGTAAPFDTGPDALFVAYSAWAEMTCFKVLGWPFPVHIFDQHTAYLAAGNILLPYDPDELRKRPRKRLPDACRAYGSKVGNRSTRSPSPAASVKAAGAITVKKPSTTIVRKTSANPHSCCARN